MCVCVFVHVCIRLTISLDAMSEAVSGATMPSTRRAMELRSSS